MHAAYHLEYRVATNKSRMVVMPGHPAVHLSASVRSPDARIVAGTTKTSCMWGQLWLVLSVPYNLHLGVIIVKVAAV